MERKIVKRKLIIVDKDSPFGRPKETVFEFTDKDQKIHKKVSKRKQHSIVFYNKMKARLEVCRYRGAQWINIFLSGGVHDIKFAIGEHKIDRFIHSLIKMRNAMRRAKEMEEVREVVEQGRKEIIAIALNTRNMPKMVHFRGAKHPQIKKKRRKTP